jgi:hypothetical protein
VPDEVDQDDAVAHHDARERDHPDHRGRGEEHRVVEAADVTGRLTIRFSSEKPGMMPIIVSGMDSMITPGSA